MFLHYDVTVDLVDTKDIITIMAINSSEVHCSY